VIKKTTMAWLTFFPDSSKQKDLEDLGFKFSPGGAHISRTMMLEELWVLFGKIPQSAPVELYAEAIFEKNVLSKTTESTRQKTMRHLRELYGLDEKIPLFRLLRKMHALDSASLPHLAIQIAVARDTLLRATCGFIFDNSEGERVESAGLEKAIVEAFPGQYSDANKIARNTSSSWTQSGHLLGRNKKIRTRVNPSPAATALALFLANCCGFHGAAVFTSPWCVLLDLSADKARSIAQEAHRLGYLNLRCIGDVVDLSFPMLDEIQNLSV
jgi:hypothetical protein